MVTAINGSVITVGEESDEGGASYTVDVSKATFDKDGASATASDIKVGDKIFVQGAVNGTTVSATSISMGHPHERGDNGKDDNEKSDASDGPESGTENVSE